MRSSEIKNSGKLSGQTKSNFSQTCSLLSQYLKEKGSFGDLTLGLSTSFQSNGWEKTGQNVGGPTGEAVKSEPETAQLTIFYGGQVIVFNDFPADKVKEITGLASKAGSQVPNTYDTMLQKPSLVPPAAYVVPDHAPQKPLQNDLPIARKASLARFFEKRRDRITARGPYHQMGNTVGAAGETKTWLGLSPQSPLQMEGHL